MMNEHDYINKLKETVYRKISNEVNQDTIEHIVNDDLYNRHIEKQKSLSFQVYYFKTLNNEKLYLSSDKFFHEFKKQYSLQGIDNDYLDTLNEKKEEILKLIREDNLVKLYFDYFKKAQIKHKEKTKERDLGSFFAKLTHTFRPLEYCALDNPIKDHFELSKESFFTALLIISSEYVHWAADNKPILETIRKKFKNKDTEQVIPHDQITDLKLLDLIFWSKANPPKK